MPVLVQVEVEDVDIDASGAITITAAEHVFVGSELDILINQIDAGQAVRAKGATGIFDANIADTFNIRGGDTILEGGEDAIGTAAAALLIDLFAGATLTARTGINDIEGKIFIEELSGDILVDTLFATHSVNLVAEGFILDAFDDDFTNISTRYLEHNARTGSIGTEDNYLELNLEPLDSSVTAVANQNIYLAEVEGDLNVAKVTALNGDLGLRADDSGIDIEDDRQSMLKAMTSSLRPSWEPWAGLTTSWKSTLSLPAMALFPASVSRTYI